MVFDIKDFVPTTTLRRWASYEEKRKLPKKPEHLEVICGQNECKVSYSVTIKPTKGASYARTMSVSIPKALEYNSRFKAAIMAYVCEGDDPQRANGIRIGLNNSDWRIVRIVVDEFEKLGLKREKWNVRLELYTGFHEEIVEKKWWSERLEIPLHCFTTPTWFEGIVSKKEFNPHGRARIQRSSAIFAAIIDNTCEKVMRDLLRG